MKTDKELVVNTKSLDKRTDNGFDLINKNIKSGGADSILAKLFRTICRDNGLTSEMFNKLMERYLNDKRNSIPQNVKDRASARGNFRKELFKNNMSWKVFCKGLRFLNVKKFDLNVDIKHNKDRITTHQINIDLGDPIFDDNDYVQKQGGLVHELECESVNDETDLTLKLTHNSNLETVLPVTINGNVITNRKK